MYEVTGRESLTARGKLHLLGTKLADDPSTNYQDLFARCLLCGACENACPRNINIRELVVEARSRFPSMYGQHGLQKSAVRMVLSRPKLLEGLVRAGIKLKNLSLLPADSGLRLKLGLLEQEKKQRAAAPAKQLPVPADGKQDVLYFTGCLARYLQPSVAGATGQIYQALTGSRLSLPDTQVCCGLAAWSSGGIMEARRLAKKNIAAFAETAGPVLTSCASCSSFLKTYPDLFTDDPKWQDKAVSFCNRVREFSSFFLPALQGRNIKSEAQVSLYYHEPCHLRYDEQHGQASHRLIDRISAVTRLDTPDRQHCCGQGGLFHVGYPELSEKIFSRAYASLQSVESGVIVTTCSGCLMQWQSGLAFRNSPVAAQHLAVFLAGCLDKDD